MTIRNRLFDHDPLSGVTELFHAYDDGHFYIEQVQDVEPLVEANKASYNAIDARARWQGDIHHVAEVPMVLYPHLRTLGAFEDPKILKRWLNDPDNVHFRMRPGRV